eukprot:TRINITY_DN2375_c0_g1_i1.p1 TRINITY_DN2375_c0_g1~~TRINITY_DN2375_c0_g1_i1.p1  ORF type:complete len:1047 (+),score=342.51 TRINITY_DN2375_c0_g1_i1:95-3235(+)
MPDVPSPAGTGLTNTPLLVHGSFGLPGSSCTSMQPTVTPGVVELQVQTPTTEPTANAFALEPPRSDGDDLVKGQSIAVPLPESPTAATATLLPPASPTEQNTASSSNGNDVASNGKNSTTKTGEADKKSDSQRSETKKEEEKKEEKDEKDEKKDEEKKKKEEDKKKEKGAKNVLEKSEQTMEWLMKALALKTFQPDDLRIWYWDTLVTVSLLYYGVFIPAQVALPREALVLGIWGHFTVECLASIVFILDVFVRLNTAYYQPEAGKLIDDRKDILKYYMKNGMWRDILAAIPADLVLLLVFGYTFWDGWLYWGVGAARFILKFLRFRDFFKVVTPVKLSAEAVNYQYSFIPNLRLVFFIILAVNFVSVIWIIVNQEGTARQVDPADRYSYPQSLYWVLYTVTTVGYGDVPVDSSGKQLFACCLFIVGVVVQGIIISKISTRMSKGDVESERVDTMKETLLVLKKFDIPDQLASEVLSFQYHRLHSDMQGGFMRVLESLPEIMKGKVGIFVRMKLICAVQMFKELPAECLIDLATCLKNDVFEPEKEIITAGQDGKEMFFLGHGFVQVRSPQGDHWGFMKPGAAFGEIALLTDAKRMASIATLTYCELFRLDKGDFWKLIRRHRALRQSVAAEVKKRNIQPTDSGTVHTIQAMSAVDYLGIEWEETATGVFILAIEEGSAAFRADLLQGMRLIDVDGYVVSSLDDTVELEDMFQMRGFIQMRLVGPSVDEMDDEREKAEEVLAGTLTPAASTVASVPHPPGPVALSPVNSQPPQAVEGGDGGGGDAPCSDASSNVVSSAEGSQRSRTNSVCSVSSNISASSRSFGVVRAGPSVAGVGAAAVASRILVKSPRASPGFQRSAPKSPAGLAGTSPGGRPAERAMYELSSRMTKIESRLEMSHNVVMRLETMTEGLLGSLGLVVERRDPSMESQGKASGENLSASGPELSLPLSNHNFGGVPPAISPPPKELEHAVQSLNASQTLRSLGQMETSITSSSRRSFNDAAPGDKAEPAGKQCLNGCGTPVSSHEEEDLHPPNGNGNGNGHLAPR